MVSLSKHEDGVEQIDLPPFAEPRYDGGWARNQSSVLP